jgi:hypothetical protein
MEDGSMEARPGWMHEKQLNNSHQTRFIREGFMMQTPIAGSKTGSNALSMKHGNTHAFDSDAARHIR